MPDSIISLLPGFSVTLALEELRLPIELYAACLLFLLPMAKKKPHFALRLAFCLILGALLSQLFFVIFVDKEQPQHGILYGFWYPILGLTAIPMTRFCFRIGWADAIFIDTCAYTAQDIVYLITNELLARLVLPILLQLPVLYLCVAVACCLLVFWLIWRAFRAQLYKIDAEIFPDRARNIVFYLVFYSLMIVMFDYLQAIFHNQLFNTYMVSAPMEILLCVFILFTQYSVIASRNAFAENSRLQQFIHNSAKYYEMSKEQIEIINRKCHDLKHTLKALAAADDADRKAYIEEAQKDVMFYQQLVHSDNEVINTILAEKSLVCGEKEIHLSCAVDSVNLSFIKVTDLYALLGNALDNAIEYVDTNNKAPADRAISLRITKSNAFLSIQVVNPYHGPDIPAGKLPRTSKGNTADHGFGLRSMQYIAGEYGGQMGIYTTDGMFTLQVVLPIATQGKEAKEIHRP